MMAIYSCCLNAHALAYTRMTQCPFPCAKLFRHTALQFKLISSLQQAVRSLPLPSPATVFLCPACCCGCGYASELALPPRGHVSAPKPGAKNVATAARKPLKTSNQRGGGINEAAARTALQEACTLPLSHSPGVSVVKWWMDTVDAWHRCALDACTYAPIHPPLPY